MSNCTRSILLTAAGALALATVLLFTGSRNGVAPDPVLDTFVRGYLDYPVVFTSRSEPASLRAASEKGEGFRAPGVPQWRAAEGRLRVLDPSGRVRELTWGRTLPDGSRIIDAMSPSVSPNGKTILFAGRRAGKDDDRFRIFRVNIDGSHLEQVTGLLDDPGCVRPPPLRFAEDGTTLSEDDRKRTDFDDLDPVETSNGILVFASSRQPDLGGPFDRRATQIWTREPGQVPQPLTASRANDRWPCVLSNGSILLTLWSHQNEVIAADGKSLIEYDPAVPHLSRPPDQWAAINVMTSGERFGMLAKVPTPMWRNRPTMDGEIAFMTPPLGSPPPFSEQQERPESAPLTVALTDRGRIASAPSSLASNSSFPMSATPSIRWFPRRSADGTFWSLATPSPAPPNDLVVSAARIGGDGKPTDYGIYRIRKTDANEKGDGILDPTPLFDDPKFVDSEPVVAYPRDVPPGPLRPKVTPESVEIKLWHRTYEGTAGQINFVSLFRHDATPEEMPGQITDAGTKSTVPAYPPGSIDRIAFYATLRDRFDDPVLPRVRGKPSLLLIAPVKPDADGSVQVMLPTGDPTMLFGLDKEGRIAEIEGAADSKGTRGRFYAFAGDHVSGVRPGGYHFCTSCHAGHSFQGGAPFVERVK